MIIPVQFFRSMSSSFSSPQLERKMMRRERGRRRTNLMVPSPTPFWPASSSSSNRKLRGITGEDKFNTFAVTAHTFTKEQCTGSKSKEMLILVVSINKHTNYQLHDNNEKDRLPAPPAVVAILPPLGCCPGPKAVAEHWAALLLLGRAHQTQNRKGRLCQALRRISSCTYYTGEPFQFECKQKAEIIFFLKCQ